MECCVLLINYDVSVWGPTEVETYVIVTNQTHTNTASLTNCSNILRCTAYWK
jgi:hypothetical protein